MINNKFEKYVTPEELTFFMIGCMVGIGIFSLPVDAIDIASQDGWISVLLGAILPFYVVIIVCFIIKKYPNINILSISRKIFGNKIGNMLNIFWLLHYTFYYASITSGGINLLRIYAVPFLSEVKISLAISIIALYCTNTGIKSLVRLNMWMFFLTCILSIILLCSIKDGNYLNIMPILGSGILNIVKGIKVTGFSYAGMEIMLLIHPFVLNKNKIPLAAINAVIITTLIYTGSTFIVIYFLGTDLATKSFYPLLLVADNIKVPIITNFRFLFVFLWNAIVIKIIINSYFIQSVILADIFSLNRRKASLLLFPVLIFIPMLFENEIIRKNIMGPVVPIISIFSLIYITLIALLIFIKNRSKSYEKS